MAKFDGPVYDPAVDDERMTKQLGRVYDLMIDGKFRTLREIAATTGDPESSVSAQLRHLRKPKHGSYIVERRPCGDRTHGLFEYQLKKPLPVGQLELIP